MGRSCPFRQPKLLSGCPLATDPPRATPRFSITSQWTNPSKDFGLRVILPRAPCHANDRNFLATRMGQPVAPSTGTWLSFHSTRLIVRLRSGPRAGDRKAPKRPEVSNRRSARLITYCACVAPGCSLCQPMKARWKSRLLGTIKDR
jgi:hypothetical protein